MRSGTVHRRRSAPDWPKSSLKPKAVFSSANLRSDPGPWSAWDGFCARAASSRYITGSEVRPVQCLHTATSRACLRVGRPARLDLLVAAGWNQAPAGPAREWSMQAVMGPLAPLSHPTGSSGWYGRQGAARRSWVRGLVSVHPPRWLPRPPPAGAQREPACGGVRYADKLHDV